ncbi:MAG TPA: flavodoxin [Anaerovoracaceae bacterium]|nr:flavodoxin [Anaerovoracaceae bacterium]
MKQAVIYFSVTNNTKKVAEVIGKEVDGDVIMVELEKPYTKVSLILKGMFQVFRKSCPKIINEIDFNAYDRIYIGTPVWGGTNVPPINTVLKNFDYEGKEVLFFCTHKGGPGKIFENMRNNLNGGKVLGEKDFQDPLANENIKNDVAEWVSLVKIRKVDE